jgi:hypothetical protein
LCFKEFGDTLHGKHRLLMVSPQRLLLLRERLLQRRYLLVRLEDRRGPACNLVDRPVLRLAVTIAVVDKAASRAFLEGHSSAEGARGVPDRRDRSRFFLLEFLRLHFCGQWTLLASNNFFNIQVIVPH